MTDGTNRQWIRTFSISEHWKLDLSCWAHSSHALLKKELARMVLVLFHQLPLQQEISLLQSIESMRLGHDFTTPNFWVRRISFQVILQDSRQEEIITSTSNTTFNARLKKCMWDTTNSRGKLAKKDLIALQNTLISYQGEKNPSKSKRSQKTEIQIFNKGCFSKYILKSKKTCYWAITCTTTCP